MGLVILALGLLFSIHSQAEVLKPKTVGREGILGTAVVEGVAFDYKVIDRGWVTGGADVAGGSEMNWRKSFFIGYSSPEKSPQLKDSIEASLLTDATAKCKELGEMELRDLAAPFFSGAHKSLVADIISFSVKKFSAHEAHGAFFCLVDVVALEQ